MFRLFGITSAPVTLDGKAPMPEELVVAEPASAPADDDRGVRVDWLYPGAILGIHLLALLALFPWFFRWTGVILALLGIYAFGTLGINIGFHRLLTHRSFCCSRWLERIFVLLGTCCVMESPAYWVAIHRRHHQFADDEQDPHSPATSFLWSHFGWYMIRVDPVGRADLLQRYAKDVMRDPLYALLERNLNWVRVIALSWLVFFGAGWGIALVMGANSSDAVQFGASLLVWGVFVRTAVVFEITMCVNSITHLWGYRTYATQDNSRNNVLIGILAAGEGWHNNHHADPSSARLGHRWWELDIAWLIIVLLEWAGLVWSVERPSPGRLGLDITPSGAGNPISQG